MARPADQRHSCAGRASACAGAAWPVPARGPVIGSLASAAYGQIALVVTGVVSARALGPPIAAISRCSSWSRPCCRASGRLGLPRAVTYFIASNPAQEASILRVIRLPVVVQAVALTALQVVILSVIVAVEPETVQWAAVAVLPLLAANLADAYGKAILQGQQRYLAFNVLRNAGTTFYLVGLLALLATGPDRPDRVHRRVRRRAWCSREPSRSPPPSPDACLTRKPQRFRRACSCGSAYVATSPPSRRSRRSGSTSSSSGYCCRRRLSVLYVVGLAFTNLPGFIARSIGFIAYPKVAGAAQQQNDEMRRFFWFSIALSGAAVVVLELTAGWLVPLFFGAEFDGAVELARILLVAGFFDGARQILFDTSSGSGRPGLGSIAELTAWLVLVPAVAILLPIWGETGVATATALAAAASFIVLVLLVRRSRNEDPDVSPATRERP